MSVIDAGADMKPKAMLGMRHVQTMIMFFCWIITLGMRNNMSLAIVDMTDVRNEEHFDWSLQIQSTILSSFYWLFMILQISGGVLANRFGGSKLVITALLANSAFTCCIPFAARYGGWQLVCACRILVGFTQGLIIPATHHLISKWAPTPEKSRTVALIYSGIYFGMAVQFSTSGLIAEAWGWPYIFYVNAICGTTISLIYIIFGADSPEKSRFISKEERLYIQTSLGQIGEQKKLKTPWKSIFTSVPFLAVFIGQCANTWGYTTMTAEVPTYLKKVMNIDIKANGILSAVPYFIMWLMIYVYGFVSDYLINKKWLSVTATRKLSNSIASYGPAIGMIILTYAPADSIPLAILFITIIVSLSGAYLTGAVTVFLDMAPNFAATLQGIGNGFCIFFAIIAPLAVGALLEDETDQSEWRKVFFLAAAIYIVGNTLFVIFGSSEVQKWNNPEVLDPESTTVTKVK